MRRILVTGSRDFPCPDIARRVLRGIVARDGGPFVLVHGDAKGVDASFRDVAREMGIPDEPHPADWEKYGRSAGPLRNQTMTKLGAEFCVAVAKDLARSVGTAGCVRLALAAGILVYHVDGLGQARQIWEV